MAESAAIRALVEQGNLRMKDIAPILGVTVQRVSQIVVECQDFPSPAKWPARGDCGGARTSSGGVAHNPWRDSH